MGPRIRSIRQLGREVTSRLLVVLIRSGVNPVTVLKQISGTSWFRQTAQEYERQRRDALDSSKFPATSPRFKIATDRFESAGTASGHYFHQDLWVAQQVFERNPQRHLDFGSRIDGFVAHVASFRQIEVGDIRPLTSANKKIKPFQVDLMEPNSVEPNMTDSASCLHALEHFGLGRYGDPIDYCGWSKGLKSLTQAVQPDGFLYLSVPISTSERVEFNAHRIFSVSTIHEAVTNDFEVVEFVYVDDHGDLITGVSIGCPEYLASFGLTHGCGIWVLQKRP